MAGTGEEVPKGEQEGGPVATSVPKGNTLEYYISLGAKSGLEGEQLTAFIKEQQGYEREERLRKRDYEKEMARIKLEGNKLEHEHKMYLAKQHEKELEAKFPSDPINSSGVSVSDKSGIIPSYRSLTQIRTTLMRICLGLSVMLKSEVGVRTIGQFL